MALHLALLPLVVLVGPMAPEQVRDRNPEGAAEVAEPPGDPEDRAEEGRRQERRVLLTSKRRGSSGYEADSAAGVQERSGGPLGPVVESTVAAAAAAGGPNILLPVIYLTLMAYGAVGFTAMYGAAPQFLGPSTIAPLSPSGINAIALLSSVALFGVGGGTTLIAATASGLTSYLVSRAKGRVPRAATERAFLEAAFVGTTVATALTGAVIAASVAGMMLAFRRPSVGVPHAQLNVAAVAGAITVGVAAAIAGAVGPVVSSAALDDDNVPRTNLIPPE